MVDFNQLTREADYLSNKVHVILDHHADYELYAETLELKDVQLMGSCMTLLSKRLVQANVVTPDLAKFISVPISLDTSMFKPELKIIKWTDGDLENYEILQKLAQDDLLKLGDRLHHIKKDVTKNLGLGVFKLLVKDFKIYKMVEPSEKAPNGVFVGVATLPVPLKAILDHFTVDGVAKEMMELMSNRDFHYFMIITSYND